MVSSMVSSYHDATSAMDAQSLQEAEAHRGLIVGLASDALQGALHSWVNS